MAVSGHTKNALLVFSSCMECKRGGWVKTGHRNGQGWVETGHRMDRNGLSLFNSIHVKLFSFSLFWQNPRLSAESHWSLQNHVEVYRIMSESLQNHVRIILVILARILVILAESRFSEGTQNHMILAESQKRKDPESCLRDQTSDPALGILIGYYENSRYI